MKEMETSQLLEIYKTLFETWRFEVNSHWQRSSYFAAFETVAIGACWHVLNGPSDSVWAGVVLSILGSVLTGVWYSNNIKTHFYAVYWLEKVAEIEKKLVQHGEKGIDFAAKILSRQRGWIRHRHLVQAVPVIFFVAWLVLLVLGISKWLAYSAAHSAVVESGSMHHVVTYESVSLAVAAASLLASVAATLIAKSSLSQAKRVADRDHKDWKQRKWFDVYFKADEAYDALDRFQVLYPSTSSPGWDTPEWERESHDLMRIMRTVHRIAVVFPKNPEIKALFDATAAFKDMEEATSKDRLSKVFDAVEGLRHRALVDPSVLV